MWVYVSPTVEQSQQRKMQKAAMTVSPCSRCISQPRMLVVRPALPKHVDAAASHAQPAHVSMLRTLKGSMLAGAASLLIAGTSHASVAETTQPGSNLGFLTNEEVAERREELGFLRAFDGKVALQSSATGPWDVKLDLRSPGTLLLRSPEGAVYVLAYESLTQIDLSDDEVVGAIATSSWETGSKAVEAVDDDSKLRRLELTREGFYDLISIVNP